VILPEFKSDAMERITHQNSLFAIIVRAEFQQAGITFFTENELSQQLAYMRHPSGKIIQPHIHNPVPREVHYTQEVLFIRRGVLRVDFYDSTQEYIESRLLKAGDTILLATGGHGFEVIEEVEMLEVKQGPYAGEEDKTRFDGVVQTKLSIKGIVS
jgi:mannose-6-phosphate isomerase-like protein (cupin superfamily)